MATTVMKYSFDLSPRAQEQLSQLPPTVETHLRTWLDQPRRAPVEGHGSGGVGVANLGEHDAVLKIDHVERHVRVESVLPKL
ncbi:hypothetical protein [Corallococcus sp. CA053C]|uniref:hypothetical protein n=1 Tax=Corallococcus sp. CA053C TaxID=2316732 RepID=UPI0011C41944|nr:hypothetical protein [Corallococcus sp. CA053C]